MNEYVATCQMLATFAACGSAVFVVHRVWMIVITIRGSMADEQKRIAEWNAEAKADGEQMAGETERLRG